MMQQQETTTYVPKPSVPAAIGLDPVSVVSALTDCTTYTSVTARAELLEGVNDLTCDRGFTLYSIESGSAECRLWDEQQSATGALSRGALFIVPCRQEFHVELDRQCHAIAVKFEWADNRTELPNWERMERRVFRDLLIFETVMRMHEEEEAAQDPSTPLIKSASALLLTTLLLANSRTRTELQRPRTKSHSGLCKAVRWIEDNLGERIVLGQLAEIAGLSDWHFLRRFKSQYRLSPYRYVQDRRLAMAKDLLIHSDLPISHVAYDCGFSSQSHLTATFNQYFGITPGRYRKHKCADLTA